MHNFPQELFDYIVDFLQNDRRTLAIVRLVSHAWNISARAHLFRSLDLLISKPNESATTPHSSGGHFHVSKVKYTGVISKPHESATTPHSSGGHFHVSKVKYPGVEKFKSLISLLEISTDISDCVREVSLGRTSSFSSTDPDSHNQNIYAVLISSILSRFSHLSDVVFREMNWATLTPSFSSCILEICKTRTLERIEIWNCQMPTASVFLEFLGASRYVKSLRLSYFRLLTVDDAEETKLSPSPIARDVRVTEHPRDTEPCTSLLHSLAIDASPNAFVLHNIFGMRPYSINFLKLRRLYLGNVDDTVGVAEFLRKAGHSLEFLDMRLKPCNQIQPRLSAIHFDLSHCPRLQHLRVSGLHWTPSLCPSEYLSSLFANTSDRSLPIEYLQLVVTVLKHKVVAPVVDFSSKDDTNHPQSAIPPVLCRRTEFHYSDWNVLDIVLSSRIFPVLQTFQISIKTIREREVDPSKLSEMFPNLKNKGVRVTCT